MTSPGVLADLLGGIRARVSNHLGAGSITPLGREILIGELLDVERRLRELAASALPSGGGEGGGDLLRCDNCGHESTEWRCPDCEEAVVPGPAFAAAPSGETGGGDWRCPGCGTEANAVMGSWGPWKRPERERLDELVVAGALIAAEIDRLQRAYVREDAADAEADAILDAQLAEESRAARLATEGGEDGD